VRKPIRWLLISLAVWIALGPAGALAIEDGYTSTYTYNYDYWGEVRESPDAYRVNRVIYSTTLGLDQPMRAPQSLFVRGDHLFIVDTGNNRILDVLKDGGEYRLERVIDQVHGTEPQTFNSPRDVAVDEQGNIYVSDMNNNRVLMMDKDQNFIRAYVRPDDSTFDRNMAFLPNKITVDSSGRVFVLATNVNKGLIKYEADGTFAGYIGANKVVYNLWDYIWKSFFTTKEQRAQQDNFVPTGYENIYIDEGGFIYATNTSFSEYDLLYDGAKPIRRLNSIGNDILIKNDRYPPIGDLTWVEQSTANGPSKFKDITVLDNDIYIAFDRTRGRIFGYDPQGIMLWAFGTKGNYEGAFQGAVSIEHMGYELFCLDETECSVTVLEPTDYGMLIYQANDEYLRGDYDKSAETWQEVLKLNNNYNMAFIGIGRSQIYQEKYAEAMENFKMAHDRTNYGRAYRYYRKILIEKNIGWMVAVIVVLLVVPLILKQRRRIKEEVNNYEHTKSLG